MVIMLTEFVFHPAPGSAVPKYLQFADALSGYLSAAEMQPGTKLPNDRILAARYGIAVVTMAKALKVLEGRGILERRVGDGTFIARPCEKSGFRIALVCHENISTDRGFVSSLYDELYSQAPQYSVDLLTLKRSPKEYLRTVKSYKLDGLIVLSATGKFIPELQKLSARGMNLAQVGMFHDELPQISFGTDHSQATVNIIDYLYSLGHRKIGFITLQIHGAPHVSTAARLRGYARAMYLKKLPVNPDWIIESSDNMKLSAVNIYKLHDSSELPTAFILDSVRMAPAIYHVFRTLNMKIPQDVSLISFDNADLCKQLSPGLTTMGHDTEELVTRIFDHLCRRKIHDGKPVSALLTERGSCAAVATI